jgi:peptidoglycan/LPS O-acetylase OafA/YrhL
MRTEPRTSPAGSSTHGSGPSTRRRYHPGLDGVRAVAIVAVLLYHLGLSRFGGGFLGVDVFFTLSGFLITTIVVDELSSTGRLRLGNFYLRRARRLLPALLLVLLVTAVLTLLFAPDATHQFAQDSRAALLYVTNWWYVFDAQDYFAATGRPPLLQHLWSLAVEEQFYLVWPLIAYAAFRWGGRRRVAFVALVGALGSTVLMAVISVAESIPGDADSARVYFGTDTHASTLLVGAALAMWWDPDRLSRTFTPRGLQAINAAGVAGLVGLVAVVVVASSQSTWLFRGGFLVVGVLSAMLIAAAAVDRTPVARALSWSPLSYLGTRSYGIYLWHWPIFQLTRPDRDLPFGGVTAATVSLALTFGAAELSYRYVEMPVRRGALPGALRRVREAARANVGIAVATTATVLAVTFSLVTAVSTAPPTDTLSYVGGVTSVGSEPLTPLDPEGPTDADGEPAKMPKEPTGVTVVGDSVVLGVRDRLARDIDDVVIDAAIARQPEDIIDRVRQRERAGRLGATVVVTVGANGYASRFEIAELLRGLAKERRVVVLTNVAPPSWVPKTNKNIRDAADGIENVVLVDWAKLSKGRRGWFYPDATHLTETGAAAYSTAVDQAVDAVNA